MVWLEINQNWIVPTDPFEGASCLFASALHPYVCEMVEGMAKMLVHIHSLTSSSPIILRPAYQHSLFACLQKESRKVMMVVVMVMMDKKLKMVMVE